jgi:hypothetical protein
MFLENSSKNIYNCPQLKAGCLFRYKYNCEYIKYKLLVSSHKQGRRKWDFFSLLFAPHREEYSNDYSENPKRHFSMYLKVNGYNK